MKTRTETKIRNIIKTENMKTTVKQIASVTFIALLLLVGNVKANGTKIEAEAHKSAETSLQLESWMTDNSIWNTNSLNVIEFASEVDADLEVESWMTNAEAWNLNNNFVAEIEAGIELESWMTSEDTWNVEGTNVEEELTIENWMIDSNVWK